MDTLVQYVSPGNQASWEGHEIYPLSRTTVMGIPRPCDIMFVWLLLPLLGHLPTSHHFLLDNISFYRYSNYYYFFYPPPEVARNLPSVWP